MILPPRPSRRATSPENYIVSSFRSLNAPDRLLASWYVVLSLALLMRSRSFSYYGAYFKQHLVIIVFIFLFANSAALGRWWRLVHDWYPTLVFVAAFEETARLSLVFVPHWQDVIILRIEAALFPVAPTAWLGRIHNSWIVEVLEFGYFTFYWIMFLVGGVLYKTVWKAKSSAAANDPRQSFRVWMDATVLGYVICYISYLLFPTEGPAHTLPRHVPSAFTGPFHWLVLFIQHQAGVHGNAFPSGHIMASVVALLAAAKWKPLLARWLTIPVLLMCIGAVYDGYHYSADIVAGALLGAAVFGLVSWSRGASDRAARVSHLPQSTDAG
ncbi:MAG TPA: phosphatase PAP2 family protein [Terriglobales bacterium]|nr:phosphatase PAP2 family protein [Terriglobales bacterium]